MIGTSGAPPGGGPFDLQPPFDFRRLSSSPAPIVTQPQFKAGDRVSDTAVSVTSARVTLNNTPAPGYQSFQDGVGDGNVCFYCISDGINAEVSYGVYTNATKTLARAANPVWSTTSQVNGAYQQVAFAGSPITVFCDFPASQAQGLVWGSATGRIITPYGMGQPSSTGYAFNNFGPGFVAYTPVFIPTPFSTFQLVYSLSASCATVASASLGLYSNGSGKPQNRLGAQLSMNAGPGSVTGDQYTSILSAGAPLPPGLYWIGNQFVTSRNDGSDATLKVTLLSSGVSSGVSVVGYKSISGYGNLSSVCWVEQNNTLPAVANPYGDNNMSVQTVAGSTNYAQTAFPYVGIVPGI